jgi:ectoine hydroxylase-related dioxygenase (phytanoyl-CoA dioxygenase family)
VRTALESNGFEIVPSVLNSPQVKDLRAAMPVTHGTRSLLELPFVRDLAQSIRVRTLIGSVLGNDCFAVRGLFFDKTENANWKVPWHQDRVVAVRERRETDGFSLWTNKNGVVHVQPPADLLERMVALRLHLDDSTEENGPLRVIPGSHQSGFIFDAELEQWKGMPVVTCTCKAGDAILMRPLLLHASSPAVKPLPRRVIHLEFAAEQLPDGLRWHHAV